MDPAPVSDPTATATAAAGEPHPQLPPPSLTHRPVNGNIDGAPGTSNTGRSRGGGGKSVPEASHQAMQAGEGGGGGDKGRSVVVEAYRHHVDEIISRTDELEQKVNEVTLFFANKQQQQPSKGSVLGSKEKEKAASGNTKKHMDATRREAVCTKRMQELMRQFGTILRNISQHKYAWPFMEPVDVKALELHDYYEIIKKPMDFGTIRKRMEAKDDSGYKNVREIYADVRLVFTNALTYNNEANPVHKMAKTLYDKFEEKWLQLLPKVIEEETRQKEEEVQAQADLQMSQQIVVAKMARDAQDELNELSTSLEELRALVILKSRRISAQEKKKIASTFGMLPAEEIFKALDVIAQLNPSFPARAQELELDINALDESTLWSLKFHMDRILKLQAKNSATKSQDNNTKRKREICDALAKTAKKRSKKLVS